MRWLYCCFGGPGHNHHSAAASFARSSKASSWGPRSAGSQYVPFSNTPSATKGGLGLREVDSREDSLNAILEAVAVRRQCRAGSSQELLASLSRMMGASAAQSILDGMAAQPGKSGLLLTSWCARQCAAFKALWLQAAVINGMRCTDAGLMLHEVCLIQHLKQDAAACFQPSTTGSQPKLRGQTARLSSSSSDGGRVPSAEHQAAAASAAHESGLVQEEDSWLDWMAFAEPPDCAVPSHLQWAATLCSDSSGGDSLRDSIKTSQT